LNSGRSSALPKKPEASLVEGERSRRSHDPGPSDVLRDGEANKAKKTRRARCLERGKRISSQSRPWSAGGLFPSGMRPVKRRRGPRPERVRGGRRDWRPWRSEPQERIEEFRLQRIFVEESPEVEELRGSNGMRAGTRRRVTGRRRGKPLKGEPQKRSRHAG
jgi:hypothetical protein